VTDDETGKAGGTFGREDGFLQGFGRDLKEIDHLEDQGLDGRIITMN